MSSLARLRLVLLHDVGELLVVDQQRAATGSCICAARWFAAICVLEKRLSSSCMACATAWLMVPSPAGHRLQPHADGLRAPLVGKRRERGDRLDLDLLLRPLQQRQQLVDALLVADLADARAPRSAAIWCSPPLSISMKRGSAFGAADLGQRVHRALAHPPVAGPWWPRAAAPPRARPWSGSGSRWPRGGCPGSRP